MVISDFMPREYLTVADLVCADACPQGVFDFMAEYGLTGPSASVQHLLRIAQGLDPEVREFITKAAGMHIRGDSCFVDEFGDAARWLAAAPFRQQNTFGADYLRRPGWPADGKSEDFPTGLPLTAGYYEADGSGDGYGNGEPSWNGVDAPYSAWDRPRAWGVRYDR